MRGFQCPKSLWLMQHNPEVEAETSAATQFQYDEGSEVGEMAQRQFPDGVATKAEYWDQEGAAKETADLIKKGHKVIFEAAFIYDGLFARADILKKDKSGWHLIEVKKATKVKPEYYQDAGVQAHIIENFGLKLKTISLMHINNKCVYPDLHNLFTIADITSEVREMMPEVVTTIKSLKDVAVLKDEPKVDIGPHCSTPYDCPLQEYCWKNVPKKSVFDLPSIRSGKKWELFNSGIKQISQLDPDDFKHARVKRAIEVTKSNKTYVDKKGIQSELKNWEWPFYFFDFETLGPAIPRYKNTKPYGQIPFQFSCHIWANPKSSELQHFEYLHTKATDPRDGLIGSMLKGLGKTGSIVAYNKKFEIGVINSLAEYDPKNAEALLNLVERFVDPLPIFQEFVYHPDFSGSFSIKNVAPALIGAKLNYDNLEIGDGSTAQAWAEQILRGKIKKPQLDSLVENLLIYCRQDTMAMVDLVKWLMEQK